VAVTHLAVARPLDPPTASAPIIPSCSLSNDSAANVVLFAGPLVDRPRSERALFDSSRRSVLEFGTTADPHPRPRPGRVAVHSWTLETHERHRHRKEVLLDLLVHQYGWMLTPIDEPGTNLRRM
jgi:hypothetical protein